MDQFNFVEIEFNMIHINKFFENSKISVMLVESSQAYVSTNILMKTQFLGSCKRPQAWQLENTLSRSKSTASLAQEIKLDRFF